MSKLQLVGVQDNSTSASLSALPVEPPPAYTPSKFSKSNTLLHTIVSLPSDQAAKSNYPALSRSSGKGRLNGIAVVGATTGMTVALMGAALMIYGGTINNADPTHSSNLIFRGLMAFGAGFAVSYVTAPFCRSSDEG